MAATAHLCVVMMSAAGERALELLSALGDHSLQPRWAAIHVTHPCKRTIYQAIANRYQQRAIRISFSRRSASCRSICAATSSCALTLLLLVLSDVSKSEVCDDALLTISAFMFDDIRANSFAWE